MNRPTLAWSEPCFWALSLNWVIREASPKPVMQFRTQASWACSGTWDWTNRVHLSDVDAAGDVLRGGDPGALGQLGRILRHGDGVQVRDEEDGVVLVLHPDPVAPGRRGSCPGAASRRRAACRRGCGSWRRRPRVAARRRSRRRRVRSRGGRRSWGNLRARAGSPLPAGHGRRSGCPTTAPGPPRPRTRRRREPAWPGGSRCASRCRCRRPCRAGTTKCRGRRRYPPGPCGHPSSRFPRRGSGRSRRAPRAGSRHV